MTRPLALRQSSLATLRHAVRGQHAERRFASTFARRGARATSTLTRWGLAGAAVYYYNTASVFAEEPAYTQSLADAPREAETYSTIDTIAAQRKAQARASVPAEVEPSTTLTDGSPQALEEEAEQQGAFNEETGEINWDCPCLGGMADGPCGEQFKAAFSCFVFSKEEPKGIDCIEHFKTMQNCFREHPDVYGSELEPDEDDLPAQEPETGVTHAVNVAREHIDDKVERATDNLASDVKAVSREIDAPIAAQKTVQPPSSSAQVSGKSSLQKGSQSTGTLAGDEGGDLVPKAWHDSK